MSRCLSVFVRNSKARLFPASSFLMEYRARFFCNPCFWQLDNSWKLASYFLQLFAGDFFRRTCAEGLFSHLHLLKFLLSPRTRPCSVQPKVSLFLWRTLSIP